LEMVDGRSSEESWAICPLESGMAAVRE
jgi:hypothetical protein